MEVVSANESFCLAPGIYLQTPVSFELVGTIDGFAIERTFSGVAMSTGVGAGEIWNDHLARSPEAVLDSALVSLLQPYVDANSDYGDPSAWSWWIGPSGRTWEEAREQFSLQVEAAGDEMVVLKGVLSFAADEASAPSTGE